MKRCTNCGYMNNDTVTKCEKCSESLEQSSEPASYKKMTGFSAADDEQPNKTIQGQPANKPSWDSAQETFEPDKYSADDDNETKPYTAMQDQDTNEEERTPPKTSKATIMNPWDVGGVVESTPEFKLISNNGKDTLSFKGNMITLNRSKLDPDNRSISSEAHVEITSKNGQWYIKDVSTNGLTYIQVKKEAMPIQPGDMIILGNKLFKFEVEE